MGVSGSFDSLLHSFSQQSSIVLLPVFSKPDLSSVITIVFILKMSNFILLDFSCLQWVGCDNRTCRRWVHVDCEVSAGNKVDSTAFYLCPSCREVAIFLQTCICCKCFLYSDQSLLSLFLSLLHNIFYHQSFPTLLNFSSVLHFQHIRQWCGITLTDCVNKQSKPT